MKVEICDEQIGEIIRSDLKLQIKCLKDSLNNEHSFGIYHNDPKEDKAKIKKMLKAYNRVLSEYTI